MSNRVASGTVLLRDVLFSHDAAGIASHTVLNIRELDLPSSEITCIMGPSGCGKTTLLLVIAGLLQTAPGSVVAAGDLFGLSPVGMVFQSPSLLPWATTRRNALLGATLAGLARAGDDQRLRGLFVRFGLEGCESLYPYQLSGGMAQRVAIIRALMANARILLLDEPFSSSDVIVRRHIHDELGRIVAEEKLIVVLVTHDVDEAVRLADRIVILSPRPATVVKIVDCAFSREQRRAPDAECRAWMSAVEAQVLSALEQTSSPRVWTSA